MLLIIIVIQGSDSSVTPQALPDLEAGVTRMLHRTASPAEAYRVLDAFATLPSSLGIRSRAECLMGRVSMAGGAGEAMLAAGVESPLLQRLSANITDVAMVGTAAELLSQLHQRAAEQSDVTALMRDSERFPEVFECLSEVEASEQNMQDILKKVRKETQRPALKYVEIQNQVCAPQSPQKSHTHIFTHLRAHTHTHARAHAHFTCISLVRRSNSFGGWALFKASLLAGLHRGSTSLRCRSTLLCHKGGQKCAARRHWLGTTRPL
jgi:hypothetical protein